MEYTSPSGFDSAQRGNIAALLSLAGGHTGSRGSLSRLGKSSGFVSGWYNARP